MPPWLSNPYVYPVSPGIMLFKFSKACTLAPSGCVCNVVGQFCGTAPPCNVGHVYECSASDGKEACEKGPSDTCKKCNKLSCP